MNIEFICQKCLTITTARPSIDLQYFVLFASYHIRVTLCCSSNGHLVWIDSVSVNVQGYTEPVLGILNHLRAVCQVYYSLRVDLVVFAILVTISQSCDETQDPKTLSVNQQIHLMNKKFISRTCKETKKNNNKRASGDLYISFVILKFNPNIWHILLIKI